MKAIRLQKLRKFRQALKDVPDDFRLQVLDSQLHWSRADVFFLLTSGLLGRKEWIIKVVLLHNPSKWLRCSFPLLIAT